MTTVAFSAASQYIGGATPKRNMRKTCELEKSFFAQRPDLLNRLTDKHLALLEKHFKQGIAAYEVQPNGDFILTHVPANYDQVGIPLLNMGLYYGHAFLITDLKQVAGTYTCGDCQARFTRADNLVRHAANNCSRGQTKINCPNNRIKAPSSAYERAFYPEQTCSFVAIKWLEWEAKKRGIHIHHARCGHGGSGRFLALEWMVITQSRKRFSSFTVAFGTVVKSATLKIAKGWCCRRPGRAK